MPFAIATRHTADYLRFDVAGPTCLADFTDLIERIAHEIGSLDCGRILVDLCNVRGRLSIGEQRQIGELAADRLPPTVRKLASVVPEGEMTRNSESAAVRKGLLLRVFDSEASALFWLLEA